MKPKSIHIFSLLILIFLTSCYQSVTKSLEIKNGLINLDDFGSNHEKYWKISGEVNYYPNKFITSKSELNQNKISVHFPRKLSKQIESYDARAYGTYVFYIHNNDSLISWAMYLDKINSAYKIFCNETIVDSLGIVSTIPSSELPMVKPKQIQLPLSVGENIIFFHVSNFHDNDTQIQEAIILGYTLDIINYKDSVSIFEIILLVLYVTVLFLTILLFILYRNSIYLVFSFISIVLIIKIMSSGSKMILDFLNIPYVYTLKIEHITHYFVIAGTVFALFMIFNMFNSKYFRHPFYILTILSSIVVVLFPFSIYMKIKLPYDIVTLFIFLHIIIKSIKMIINKENYAMIHFIIFLLGTFVGIYEFINFHFIYGYYKILNWAMFLLVLTYFILCFIKFKNDKIYW